ncbi:MAG TPA: YIP1 family protein [Pyrinomonadaceae bacterium]|jgi:hypothetical protein|nr:YIP1 family protein [Pyrinomonadaceae bacterium]
MEEPNNAEWQAPPPPEGPVEEEGPQMSEVATLANIFIEPGNTFRAMRAKPKFLLALIIMIVVSLGFWFAIDQKIGVGEVFIDQMKKSPQYEQMDGPTREKAAGFYRGPLFKGFFFGIIVIGSIFVVFIGGLIYWLLANAMGGSARYLQGVSVWVYSSYAPALVAVIANILVLLLKSKDDIDSSFMQSGGLVRANPTALIDTTHSPVLNAILAPIDLFGIFALILGVIGLRTMMKISNSSAWSIALGLKLLGIIIGIASALIFGGGTK